jgi:hypothetical protein
MSKPPFARRAFLRSESWLAMNGLMCSHLLTALSICMWILALSLPAYIADPSPHDELSTVRVVTGAEALAWGLLLMVMVVGIFSSAPAVVGNWIIVRGISNIWATRCSPVCSLRKFAAVHLGLLALSMLAFGADFHDSRSWKTGPAAYVWFASLVTMTIANYCAHRWKCSRAISPYPAPAGKTPLPSESLTDEYRNH